MDEAKKLGSEKISKLLFQYSVPAILAMVISAIYNMADRIFVGNSPELGSARNWWNRNNTSNLYYHYGNRSFIWRRWFYSFFYFFG